ncbi:MAG: hypothetical protein KDE47_07620 [Caldilineaceae bacterium]|nr:hypothetical protein [Caldilineaceae bacterium]
MIGGRISVAGKSIKLPMDAQLDGGALCLLCYPFFPGACFQPPVNYIKRNGRVLEVEVNSGRMRTRFGVSDGEKQTVFDTFSFIIDIVGADKLIDPTEFRLLQEEALQQVLAARDEN